MRHTSKKPALPNDNSRRQFTKTIAATIFAAPLTATLVNAQTPASAKEAIALPTPAPSPIPTQQAPSPVAEAYAEVARVRFGKFVTPEQMSKVKEDLVSNLRAAERLRNYKLENGDEPDFVFFAG